jgi:hypothetical protein
VSIRYNVSLINYKIKLQFDDEHFFFSFNYELYFGFSWIFVFISVDRWTKVEWPTKSQTICTRQQFIYLCILTLILSLIQNTVYTFLCMNDKCKQKNLTCEIFIHVIYITIYMTIPIALILISISRTCLITLHINKRFRPSNQQSLSSSSKSFELDTVTHWKTANGNKLNSVKLNSSVNSPLTTTTGALSSTNNPQIINSQNYLTNYATQLRRRRSRLDTQMVILISINVVPFIIVHIINEIAYLFENYSPFVANSRVAQLCIILVYLSWYLISATRFYTNCLLSRIYREEFKNRLRMLRLSCKPRIIIPKKVQSRRHSSRFYVGSNVNGVESTFELTAN